jgi:cytochrome oxidase Cu insertion factor (SCO1/SenC/PrrC family)
LTGKPDELEPVWKAYYVGVEAATAPGGDIVHTSGVYVVDQLGRERWYLSGSLTDPASDGPPLSTVLVKRI